MIKRMFIMLFLVGLLAAGVIGFKMFGHKMMMQAMSGMMNPVFTVSSTKAAPQEWQQELSVVGTLRAVKGADLSAESAGTVQTILFDSGEDVTEGKVLLHLRSDEETARLQSLEAQTKLAILNVERDEKMLAVKAISQATRDTDIATLENLKAQVEAQKAVLAKKTVAAPFSGRLGLRQVDVGEYLTVGKPIVTLQQLDPIFLDFFVPQQDLPKIKIGQKIVAHTNTFPDTSFDGEITAVSPKVDESTRNVAVRAVFANSDKKLQPGMFATASITYGTPIKYLTLPQTAITFNPYGSTVYVVKNDGIDEKGNKKRTATLVFVKTGNTRGDQIAILSGVKEGDEVVTAGQLKLHNGSAVAINNNLQLKDDANPMPTDK